MLVPITLHAIAQQAMKVKSGETYYVSAEMVPDVGFKLAVLDPDEGQHLLQNAKFSTSRQR